MSKVLKDMKQAGIKVHSKLETIIRVNAKDPDMACRIAVGKVCQDIAKERECPQYKEIAVKAREVISVTKIRKAAP